MEMSSNGISEKPTSHEVSIAQTKLTRQHIVLSVCLYSTFLGLGLTASLMAPSFLHLAETYNTDVSGLSVMFTFTSIGYLLGAFLCAALFDRASHELQYFLLTALEAGLTIAIPLLPGLPFLFAVAALQNVVMGYIDASGQSYVIRLWSNHSFKEPLMNGMHAIWSVGAFICPFIVGPFLVELPDSTATTVHLASSTPTIQYNVSLAEGNTAVVVTEDRIPGLEKIRYPYLIVGCILGLVSLLSLTSFFVYGNHTLLKSSKTESKQQQKPGEALSFKIPMLVMQFFYFFFYIWYEVIPGTLLATFAIEGLNWAIQDGPRLMSVYWGAHGLGRIIGIPVSFCLKPQTMILCNTVICILAFILMFIALYTNSLLLWIATAMAGFAMSTLFASAILWTSEYIHISGALGAFFLISASIGGMTGPTLAGFLFEHSSYMWVVILSLIASLSQGLVFVVMLVFVKVHDRKVKKAKAQELQDMGEPINKTSL